MPKRTTIKGLGADAFFTNPSDNEASKEGIGAKGEELTAIETDRGQSMSQDRRDNTGDVGRDVENSSEVLGNFVEEPSNQNTVLLARQQASIPVKLQNSKTAKQQDSKTNKRELVKATFYLEPGHITMLEEMRLAERKKRGKGIDKSELVRRAIELLSKQ